jgi:cell division protein ZapB
MSSINDLVDRVERLLVRHEELKRTNALLEQQVQALSAERDSLRSRLSAARSRIDALLDRLPLEAAELLTPDATASTAATAQDDDPSRKAGA